MMRECNKCVYHASGSCSEWECKGTKTIEDVKADAIRKFAEWLTKSDYANGYFDTENGFVSVDRVLAKYEKEGGTE